MTTQNHSEPQMKIRDFERIDTTTGEIGKGDLFIGPEGQQVNLKTSTSSGPAPILSGNSSRDA